MVGVQCGIMGRGDSRYATAGAAMTRLLVAIVGVLVLPVVVVNVLKAQGVR